MTTSNNSLPKGPIYQGEYGTFIITPEDEKEVWLYRWGLIISALSFVSETILIFFNLNLALNPVVANSLFWLFVIGLGISLTTIHIYLKPLHNLLKVFWAIGTVFALFLALTMDQALISYVYFQPLNLLGIGFIFVALTGIYFKEAFCFRRLETKFLTPLVPLLLLGHLSKILPLEMEKIGLVIWGILFMIFALGKLGQSIASDIGDKSIFQYLKNQSNPHYFENDQVKKTLN